MHGERAVSREKQRLGWLDSARGIGIILVAIAHTWTSGPVRDAIYSFHMPLFFIFSGYMLRPPKSLSHALKQSAALMLSYAAFLLLIIAADTVIETAKGYRPMFHNWPQDWKRILLGGSELRGPFTVFWFVPCLVFARLICSAFAMRFADPLRWPWLALAAAMAIVGYVAGAATDFSPLGLLTVPMACVFIWAGWAIRSAQLPDWLWWAAVPIALAGMFLFDTMNMKAGYYGWPLLSALAAIASSLLLMRFARLPFADARVLHLFGKASLVIMYLHVPVIHYLAPWLGKWMLFVLSLVIPLAVWWSLERVAPARWLFLARR